MDQKPNTNLRLPLFSWLFFLFLSSGISCYHNNFGSGKPVLIERVDQFISNAGSSKSVGTFILNAERSYQPRHLKSQFLQIKRLSQRLEKHVRIHLNNQPSLYNLINKNTTLLFRIRNLASASSDHLPDFIS